MALPKATVQDMYSWYPCYDIDLAFEDPTFKGDAIDVLNYEDCPIADRFWVMARPVMIPDEMVMHQFGLDIVAHVSPSASMVSAIAEKARWMAGLITDEAMDLIVDAEQVALDVLAAENAIEKGKHGMRALAGETDTTIIDAHNLLFSTQTICVNAIDTDPRTASYKALAPLLALDSSLAEWARLKMIELLGG